MLRWRPIAALIFVWDASAYAHGIHNISLRTSTSSHYAAIGQGFHWYANVYNGGLGDPAYGIVVTGTFPKSMTISDVQAGPFRCSLSSGSVTCSAEQIPARNTTIDFTMVGSQAGDVTLNADVMSLGTIDANPSDNHGSSTVRIYDPTDCSAQLTPLLPLADARVFSPAVLSWTPLPFPATYDVFAATGGGSVAHQVGGTSSASLTVDVPASQVDWYVEAVSTQCPRIQSAVSRFISLGVFPWLTFNATIGSSLSAPWGVAFGSSGDLWITDQAASTVERMIGQSMTIVADASILNGPTGIAVAPDGSVIVADTGNNVLRLIDASGTHLLAGAGTAGFLDGPAAIALFSSPTGVAVDQTGVIYVADTGNHAIRKVDRDGQVTTVAASLSFDSPAGIAIGPDGVVYIGDTGDSTVRKVGRDGSVTTLFSLADVSGSPAGIAIDGRGNLLISDAAQNRLIRIGAGGDVTIVTGTVSDVRLDSPHGVTIEGSGQFAIADTGNHVVRLGQLNSSPRRRAANE